MNITVGTCGTCGSAVTVPKIWMGVDPPTPMCRRCGSRPRNPHGPMIDMAPRVPHRAAFDRAIKLAEKESGR